MRDALGWFTVGLMLSSMPCLVSCEGKGKEDVRTVISQSPSPSGEWIATVDQIEFKSGFTTPDFDRVVLSGAKQTDPEGEVVFIENRMPDSEKPTLSWSSGRLLISISRDADIVPLQKKMSSVPIDVIRRKELQGRAPIGPLMSALQDSQRTWSSDDLTSKVLETCRGLKEPVSRREIADWVKLLDDDRVLKTDTTLFAGVQVREVALLCIEELTGEPFYPRKGQELPWREQLATARGGKHEKWTVVKIDPAEMPAIKKSIKAWLDKNHR